MEIIATPESSIGFMVTIDRSHKNGFEVLMNWIQHVMDWIIIQSMNKINIDHRRTVI